MSMKAINNKCISILMTIENTFFREYFKVFNNLSFYSKFIVKDFVISNCQITTS